MYSGASVSAARFFPIVRLKSYICFLFFVFSFLNPFKGIIAFEYIGNSVVIRIGSKRRGKAILPDGVGAPDSAGNLLWEMAIGGSEGEMAGVQQTPDGGYIASG